MDFPRLRFLSRNSLKEVCKTLYIIIVGSKHHKYISSKPLIILKNKIINLIQITFLIWDINLKNFIESLIDSVGSKLNLNLAFSFGFNRPF